MLAAILESSDRPLKIGKISPIELLPGEVVVEIKAAGLNHRDLWIQKGAYHNIQYPCIPGSDGAGIVKGIGAEINNHLQGKKVLINPSLKWGHLPQGHGGDFQILGMPTRGTFAQRVVVPVENIFPIPDGLNFVQAAALPLGGLTAYRALFYRAQAKKNQSLLITGAGGGVSTFLLQFAVAAGLKTFVTSSSNEKIQKAIMMKAKFGVIYTSPSWADELRQNVPDGFDIIIDSAGGKNFPVLLQLLKTGGTIVNYGGTAGKIPEIIPQRIFWKQVNILGTTMGSPEDFSQMLDFVSRHKITPVIDRIFPFGKINSAFRYLENQKQFGKIVLRLNNDLNEEKLK